MKKRAISLILVMLFVILSAAVVPTAMAQTADPIPGDADGDGEVTIIDATRIQRWLADICDMDGNPYSGRALTETELKSADIDGDGEVTIIDATKIQRMLAGSDDPEQPSGIEHKLLSGVRSYQKNYETGEWELSQTTTIEYENGYPVLFDLLESYEDAEHIQTNISYTFDGDLPLTRTEINEVQDLKTTVEYSDGRVYNVKEETVSSGSYRKLMYQYGHGDDYFTMVLHDVFRPGNEFNPDVYMEEVDSVSITTENGLLKSTTNTGMYAYWSEKQEKKWIRFNGTYTTDYDSDGIVSLRTARFSSFGSPQQSKYEVQKENGKITGAIQYVLNGEGGWEPFTKYEFEYNDTGISASRYSIMMNYYLTNGGGNYYIYNWY